MAWVYKRGARWYLAYRSETGKLRRQATRVRFKAEAEKLAAQLEGEAELVRLGMKRRHVARTWDGLCDQWERDILPNLRAQHTRAGELRRELRPAFTGRLLHDISAADVEEWLTGMRGRFADSTRRLYLMRLGSLFNYAVNLEWLGFNPVSRVPRVKVPERRPSYFQLDEVRRLLELAPDYFRPILATAFYCGLRRGEIAGLKWEDVDFEQRILHIRRSFAGPTKSGKEAAVPLPVALIPYLREAKKLRSSAWCFPSNQGKPRHKGWAASLALSKVLKAAGITRPLTFHATRHTWATHTYAATKDLRLVQRLARHSSASITEKYAHLLDETITTQVNKLTYGDELKRRRPELHGSSTGAGMAARRAAKRAAKLRR